MTSPNQFLPNDPTAISRLFTSSGGSSRAWREREQYARLAYCIASELISVERFEFRHDWPASFRELRSFQAVRSFRKLRQHRGESHNHKVLKWSAYEWYRTTFKECPVIEYRGADLWGPSQGIRIECGDTQPKFAYLFFDLGEEWEVKRRLDRISAFVLFPFASQIAYIFRPTSKGVPVLREHRRWCDSVFRWEVLDKRDGIPPPPRPEVPANLGIFGRKDP